MADKPIPPITPAKDIEVDVVIVGAGTGMAAALSAHEAGLSTLIIEKSQYMGGSTALSGGAFWIPGNKVLRDSGADYDQKRAHLYLENVVGDSAPKERWEAFLEHGPAAVDVMIRNTPLEFMWCKDYSDYHSDLPGSAPSSRSVESKPFNAAILGAERARLRPSALGAPIPMPVTGVDYKWMNLMAKVPQKGFVKAAGRAAQGIGGLALKKEFTAGGEALAAGMFAGVIKAGIPYWTETGLVEILTDAKGAVTGIKAEQKGKQVTITARKGVILSAGGFDHNAELRQKYQSETFKGQWALGAESNTGDAITLGQKVGADITLMDQVWWFPSVAPTKEGGRPGVMLAERSLPGSFMVGSNGKRFINESIDYMSYGQTVLQRELDGDPIGDTWIVFDQEYKNSYLFAAISYPRTPLPEAWYEAGIAHKAESPQELANKMGVPVDAFVEQMNTFNGYARAGRDDDFNRGEATYDRYYGDPTVTPNPNLRQLSGTLYAVKIVCGDLGTCGGLKANENAQVLRADGTVIDGLYAIGNSAGNAFGNRYPGAGATIGQGIVYGYIAAQHAKSRS